MDLNEKTLPELAGLLKVKDWAVLATILAALLVGAYYFGGFVERTATERVRNELVDTKRQMEQARSTAQQASRDKDAATRALNVAKEQHDKALSTARAQLKAAEARLAEVADAAKKLESAETTITTLQAAIARAEAELAQRKQEFGRLRDSYNARFEKLRAETAAEAATEIASLTKRLRAATESLRSSQAEIAALQTTIDSLKASATARPAAGGAATSGGEDPLFPKGTFELSQGQTRDITDANLLIGITDGRGCVALSANGRKRCINAGDRFDLKWPHAPFYLKQTFASKSVCFLDVAGIDTSGARPVAALRLKCE